MTNTAHTGLKSTFENIPSGVTEPNPNPSSRLVEDAVAHLRRRKLRRKHTIKSKALTWLARQLWVSPSVCS